MQNTLEFACAACLVPGSIIPSLSYTLVILIQESPVAVASPAVEEDPEESTAPAKVL